MGFKQVKPRRAGEVGDHEPAVRTHVGRLDPDDP